MQVSGALAWPPAVARSKEEIDDFLSGRWSARLATMGQDGYPPVTPLWYYWEGQCVYFALTRNRRPCKPLIRSQPGRGRGASPARRSANSLPAPISTSARFSKTTRAGC